MEPAQTEEEKQFIELCGEKDTEISQFTALLEQGVRLNIHNKGGWHPLWRVSMRGRTDLVDLFLQRGAEVDLPSADKYGNTALIIACTNGHTETAKLLLQRGALINYQQKTGYTALFFASKNDHAKVVEVLLKSGAQVNKGSLPPLYIASLNGRLNIVRILLDHGADVNQPTATKKRTSSLSVACGENHPQVAQLLITCGANTDYQDSYGATPLHLGSQNGHLEIVKILVQSQANLNVINKLGNTPLHQAVENGHSEVVKQLLLSQANLDIKNNDGKTPLQLAEEKKYSEIGGLLKTGVSTPEDLSYEQLVMWLSNHPKLVGDGYQQDISKLKDARVNGFALLTLNESKLEHFGVSYGFQVTLMNIIESLKSSQKPPESKRLPPQHQQSPACSAAPTITQDQTITSAADKKMKIDELPTLDELLILKYMDKGKKKLRIISEASHKWKDIANLICGDANVTSVLEQRCHSDPNECLKQTFINYFISKKPQRYTQDWNGLIEILDDVDLETLAKNIKQALSCACT